MLSDISDTFKTQEQKTQQCIDFCSLLWDNINWNSYIEQVSMMKLHFLQIENIDICSIFFIYKTGMNPNKDQQVKGIVGQVREQNVYFLIKASYSGCLALTW